MNDKVEQYFTDHPGTEAYLREITEIHNEYEYGIPANRVPPIWQDPRNAGAPFTMENGLMPVLIV